MAVAVPKRHAAPAPPPARTTPPKRRKAPAPARRSKAASPRGSAVAAPAPARRAPARAPQRARPKTRRTPGRVIPLAGRTAVAVGQLPDSSLIVRLTRGRAWIGVLGFLLVGIVALNVVTLSFAASAGKIDEQLTALEKENKVLGNRDATITGVGRVRDAGSAVGLSQPPSDTIHFTDVGPDDVATAAARLAAAGQ